MFGQTRAAAVAEDFVTMMAFAARVMAHVFDYAQHRNAYFVEHRNAALDVKQGQLLRRSDDDTAGESHALSDSELGVAGAGR